MASPTIESLCCISSTNSFSKHFLNDFQSIPYNVVSILAALFGICGAVYQVLPRTPSTGASGRGSRFFRTRSRLIIKWLALADLMASLGILVRSASWLADDTFGSGPDDSPMGQYFCIITSGIIHYFYTATYCWTFVYALDVKLVMEDVRVGHKGYHALAWTIPLALCLFGLLILYLPDLNCHSNAVNPYARFLPNYLSSFLPIVVVMVGNPILYCIAFSKVEKRIMSARGRFTQSERQVVGRLRKKFFLINLVFYVCWLPNVANGVVLWTTWSALPKAFILVVWYLMAILNPMQAVFNSMVYRSWESGSRVRAPAWLTSSWWQSAAPTTPHLPPTYQPSAPPYQDDEDEGDEDEEDSLREEQEPAASSSTLHERTPLLPAPSNSAEPTTSKEFYSNTSSRFKYKVRA